MRRHEWRKGVGLDIRRDVPKSFPVERVSHHRDGKRVDAATAARRVSVGVVSINEAEVDRDLDVFEDGGTTPLVALRVSTASGECSKM
jgi:hypothetical protein